MRFKWASGFTLIELIVTMAMLGTILLFLSPLLGNALSYKSPMELLRKAEVAGDSQQLIQRLKFYFSRARDGVFTPGSVISFRGINLVSNALVVRSDMRPCATFDPVTSGTNLNRIEISCCAPNIPITAKLPGAGGGTRTLTSNCGADWGLTIREFNPVGKEISATCNRFITNFTRSVIGSDSDTNQLIFNLDFMAQTETFWNGQIMGRNPVFFNLTSFYQNTTDAPMVACSQSGDLQ